MTADQGGVAMMTWRERIAAGRARGSFTQEDREDMGDCRTCFFGEVLAGYGIENSSDLALRLSVDPVLDQLVFRDVFPAVWRDRFDQAETILEQIEDRVLQLKRNGAA